MRWEQNGASHVTYENVGDLMSEEELHERRRLFFAAMRRPEMRMFRLALYHLLWDKGLEWSDILAIKRIEIDPYAPGCWMMLTDRFQVVSLNVSPEMTYEDFHFGWVHDPANPTCQCDYCDYIREMAHPALAGDYASVLEICGVTEDED